MSRFLMLFVMPLAWAANDLTITPSAGMPIITVNGQPTVDVRQIGAGNLVSFDVYLTDIDFTLAATEFRIYFPIMLTGFSENQQDWQNNTDAVFAPAPAFEQALVLPADGNGNRLVPPNMVGNLSFMVGLVFRDSLARWKGTPQKPHPGGLLGTITVRYNPVGVSTCDSKIESIQIGMGPLFGDGQFDYFADQNGDRVALTASIPVDLHGEYGLPAYFGNPDASIRADANDDNIRNALDALPAANCALNGPDDPSCLDGVYWTQYPDRFTQVFDFNCDGQVNGLDALGCARLALGRVFNDPIGTSNRISLPDFSGDSGVMAVRTYQRNNQQTKPILKNSSRDWFLHWEAYGQKVEVLLLRKHSTDDAPFPELEWTGPDQTLVQPIDAMHINAAGQQTEYR